VVPGDICVLQDKYKDEKNVPDDPGVFSDHSGIPFMPDPTAL
jgi:hypothetical protein